MNTSATPALDADRVWGEAAIYFSLDLAAGLWDFLATGLDYNDVLQANRKSILENRKKIDKSGSSSHIAAIARRHTAPLQRGTLSYSSFVENKFAGFQGYARNGYFLGPLTFDCLNFKENLRDKLRTEFGEELDLNLANKLFDDHRAMLLGREALRIDRAIEAQDMSRWDRELLEKHRGVLGTIDPLGAVVQLGISQLKSEAMEKFTARLKPETGARFRQIFNQTIGSH